MYEWKQEPQGRIGQNRRHIEGTMVAMKEQSDSSCGKQCFGDVVISAFREIEESLEAEESRVWIHVEANRTWLTIDYEAKVSSKKEFGKRLKYQVEASGQTMKSRLYQMMGVGPQKEYPVGDWHEIAGEAKGRKIADITSTEIVDDFMAAFEAYASKKDEEQGYVSLGELSMTEEKKQQTPVGLPEQSELDGPAGQQDTETKDVGATELIEHDSRTCYLCGCRISAKRDTDYKCPRCGNRACASCFELLLGSYYGMSLACDTFSGACLACDSKANKLKAVSIALVGIVIVVAIILCLVVI